MSTARHLVRHVVPPVLGLALALLLVHPLGADPAPLVPVLPDTGSPAAPPTTHVEAGGTVVVSIPAVAFTESVTVRAGRIHTPVLVNASEPAGTARIVGLAGCSAPASPGVVAWLDCAYPGTGRVTVAVTLVDGRRFTHTVAPTIA